MEITVINDSGFIGWTASALRIGEVYMTSVATMVENVLAKADLNPISRLNICDHGNPDEIQFGKDTISVATIPLYRYDLEMLRGQFTSDGFVHLQHCEIGQNAAVLTMLAAIFEVGVIAGTGRHHALLNVNLGHYVQGNPDGSVNHNAPRPGTTPTPKYVDPFGYPNKTHCFAPGTLVRCPGSTKRIEEITAGDRVYSYDLDRERVITDRVARQEIHVGAFPVHELHSNGGGTAAVTDTHRFHVPGQGWVPLEAMTTGSPLAGIDGAQQVANVARDMHMSNAVFNLKVARNANYFVGDQSFLVRDH